MDAFLTVLRVGVSLAVVVGIVWFAHRKLSRTRGRLRNPMTLVARQGLGNKASVAVIDLDGQRFVLGVTEHAVNLIATAPQPEPEAVAEPAVPDSGAAFAARLAGARRASGSDDLSAAITVGPWGAGTRQGMLAGSILSPDTWRRAVAAFKQAR